ncbi:hypothetical protein TeGR_g11228, partial [Tetraparma gracilis]
MMIGSGLIAPSTTPEERQLRDEHFRLDAHVDLGGELKWLIGFTGKSNICDDDATSDGWKSFARTAPNEGDDEFYAFQDPAASVPSFTDFFLFDILNSADLLTGVSDTAIIAEVGPFVFQEWSQHIDMEVLPCPDGTGTCLEYNSIGAHIFLDEDVTVTASGTTGTSTEYNFESRAPAGVDRFMSIDQFSVGYLGALGLGGNEFALFLTANGCSVAQITNIAAVDGVNMFTCTGEEEDPDSCACCALDDVARALDYGGAFAGADFCKGIDAIVFAGAMDACNTGAISMVKDAALAGVQGQVTDAQAQAQADAAGITVAQWYEAAVDGYVAGEAATAGMSSDGWLFAAATGGVEAAAAAAGVSAYEYCLPILVDGSTMLALEGMIAADPLGGDWGPTFIAGIDANVQAGIDAQIKAAVDAAVRAGVDAAVRAGVDAAVRAGSQADAASITVEEWYTAFIASYVAAEAATASITSEEWYTASIAGYVAGVVAAAPDDYCGGADDWYLSQVSAVFLSMGPVEATILESSGLSVAATHVAAGGAAAAGVTVSQFLHATAAVQSGLAADATSEAIIYAGSGAVKCACSAGEDYNADDFMGCCLSEGQLPGYSLVGAFCDDAGAFTPVDAYATATAAGAAAGMGAAVPTQLRCSAYLNQESGVLGLVSLIAEVDGGTKVMDSGDAAPMCADGTFDA